MSNGYRTAGCVLAVICSQLASAAFGATLLSREEITAATAVTEANCRGPTHIAEEQKLGRTLAFVKVTQFYEDNNACTEDEDVDWIAIYERIGDQYRFLRKASATSIRFIEHRLVSQRVSTDPDQPPETLVVIEWHQEGSGNFVDYELYRLGTDALEPVEIQRPAMILSKHLAKGQRVGNEGLDFADDRIVFSMSIVNPGESTRHATGGSAQGEMKLLRGPTGLKLIPVPESLQLPHESNRLNALGIAAYREKRFDAAANYYRQALRWNPRNYEAQSNLALVHLRQNNLTEAIRISSDVLNAPDAPTAIQASAAYNVGRAYEAMGERDRAIEFYSTAVRLQDTPERRAAIERLRAER
jgi:hypothetical protein